MNVAAEGAPVHNESVIKRRANTMERGNENEKPK